jgi:hypothetical protein
MVQAFTEAIKLRIEFIVLNSLVEYSQPLAGRHSNLEWQGEVDFITTPGEQNMRVSAPAPFVQSSFKDIQNSSSEEKPGPFP